MSIGSISGSTPSQPVQQLRGPQEEATESDAEKVRERNAQPNPLPADPSKGRNVNIAA